MFVLRRIATGILAVAMLLGYAHCGAAAGRVLHYAPLGQQGVAYIDMGKGGTPLLFVHGWGCDHTFWRYQIPFFAQGRRVLALDLPGHGWSDKPKISYSQELFAQAVGAVLDAAKEKRAVLVGHSMGMEICRSYALVHPERVAGLVIVDGAFFHLPQDPKLRAEYIALMRQYDVMFTEGPDYRASVAKFLESGMFVPETPPALRTWVTDKILGTPAYVGTTAMHDFLKIERWQHPQPISVPTLAVFTEMSASFEPGQAEYLKTLFPKLEYEEWGKVGHFLQLEVPDKLNARMAAFLEKLP